MIRVLLLVAMLMALHASRAACQAASSSPSTDARLEAVWSAYRERYIAASGAVADPSRNQLVSSEAQSYALVRAVWMRDRATFERVLAWTDGHLRRPDGLYSWAWDPVTMRVIDANSATDGDIDIAYALAMASVVFERPGWASQAREVVRAIRTGASVSTIAGWFPSAGNWAGPERIVNLSYFYPYATPWFARLDPEGGWEAVDRLGYALVERSLDAGTYALPADFNVLTPEGTLTALPPRHALSADFSYDAMRISWRLEMACRLGSDPRACALSARIATRLRALVQRDGRLVTRYATDGTPRNEEQSMSFFAAFLPALSRLAPDVAREWRATHFSDEAVNALMAAPARYYDANWVWFGLAAADGLIGANTAPIEQLEIPK